LKFEEKIRGREENNLLKICRNEKMSRKKKIYIVEKKNNILINGWALETIEEWRNKDGYYIGMIIRRENDIQKQGDESRIREARYNKKI